MKCVLKMKTAIYCVVFVVTATMIYIYLVERSIEFKNDEFRMLSKVFKRNLLYMIQLLKYDNGIFI